MWKVLRTVGLSASEVLTRRTVRHNAIREAWGIREACTNNVGTTVGVMGGRREGWIRKGAEQNEACLGRFSSNLVRRGICRKTGDPGVYKPPPELPETDEDLERIPVPDGIPTDKFEIYQVQQDWGKAYQSIKSRGGIFAVHGPSEVWAPYGLVKGHGAGGGIFAIVMVGGHQYQVIEGDVLYTNRIKGEVNTTHVFDNVLALGAVDWSWIGTPLIAHASVVSTIEEQAQSGKIYITKFKKRTGYRRRMGHRQLITRFRIDEIRYKLPSKEDMELWEGKRGPMDYEPNFMFKL